jgi:hypothetical protein
MEYKYRERGFALGIDPDVRHTHMYIHIYDTICTVKLTWLQINSMIHNHNALIILHYSYCIIRIALFVLHYSYCISYRLKCNKAEMQ